MGQEALTVGGSSCFGMYINLYIRDILTNLWLAQGIERKPYNRCQNWASSLDDCLTLGD